MDVKIGEGKNRILTIMKQLQMFMGSCIEIEVLAAEYEKHFNSKLENDLQVYFGINNLIVVLGRYLSDSIAFHYSINEGGKPTKFFLRSLLNFSIPQNLSKTSFCVLEKFKSCNEASPQKYTTSTSGEYSSDESNWDS